MTLGLLLVLLLIVGVVFALVPVDPTIKRVIYVVLAALLIFWLLAAFGDVGGFGFYHHGGAVILR